MKKNKGFSVVELLVTMLVLGILLTMVGKMGKSSVSRASFSSTMNSFVADVAYARQLAALENRYVAVVFDPGGTRYTLRVQLKIGANPGDVNNYRNEKVVSPMGGDQFVAAPTNFAVGPTGTIKSYPVNPAAGPVSVTLTFVKKAGPGSEKLDYKKDLIIYPTGGVKIE